MKLYGNRFLRVLLPTALAEQLRRDRDKSRVWQTFVPMMDYWDALPDAKQIGGYERRCAGFDLSADPAWVCVEVNFFDDISVDTLMLLKLKFDLSEEQHRPRPPEDGWVL